MRKTYVQNGRRTKWEKLYYEVLLILTNYKELETSIGYTADIEAEENGKISRLILNHSISARETMIYHLKHLTNKCSNDSDKQRIEGTINRLSSLGDERDWYYTYKEDLLNGNDKKFYQTDLLPYYEIKAVGLNNYELYLACVNLFNREH